MGTEIAKRGGMGSPPVRSGTENRQVDQPAGDIVKPMSEQCAAHGCFLASVNQKAKMAEAIAGQLSRYDQTASMCYSLCRSIKEGDCACSQRGSMPCPSMVSAIKYMASMLVPALLASHGITDESLRRFR